MEGVHSNFKMGVERNGEWAHKHKTKTKMHPLDKITIKLEFL